MLDAVRPARPARLLVVADGPRADRPGEAEACARTRAVLDRVDWPCEVETEFSPVNLGCRRRISSGIDWVFRRVEEAVILEDDCVPGDGFFRYCDAMLERHRGDERVMAVTGCNFQFGRRRGDASYYYSHFIHVWGWATWRRAWGALRRGDAGVAVGPGRRLAARGRRKPGRRGRVARHLRPHPCRPGGHLGLPVAVPGLPPRRLRRHAKREPGHQRGIPAPGGPMPASPDRTSTSPPACSRTPSCTPRRSAGTSRRTR